MTLIDDYRKAQAKSTWDDLSTNAKEVLGQLFLNGPTWDGYLVSKSGRNELMDFGMIERGFGWQWLNERGVKVAVDGPVGNWMEGRWRKKQCR